MITIRDFIEGKANLEISGHGSTSGWANEMSKFMLKDRLEEERKRTVDENEGPFVPERDLANTWKAPKVQASGTSEGVKKSWESRNRGSGKFGEGAKSQPAWGYGGDDATDSTSTSSDATGGERKFGKGAKSQPPWGYD